MRTIAIAAVLFVATLPLAVHADPHRRRNDEVVVNQSELLRQLGDLQRQLDAITGEGNGRRRRELARRAERDFESLRQELRDAPRAPRGATAVVDSRPPPPVMHPPPPVQQLPPPPPVQQLVYPVNPQQLGQLKHALTRESFPRDRLQVLESAAPSNYFVVNQVRELLALFEFPRDRLKAAAVLKPRILDPENHFQLYGAFEYPSDKAELRRILEN